MIDALLNALVQKERHSGIVAKEHGLIDVVREGAYDLFDIPRICLIELPFQLKG